MGAVQPVDIPGHNASLAILGVFILWFGWYGFNPGSALLIIGSGEIAATAAVNTTLSAAGGTVSALMVLMALEFMSTGHVVYDLIGASNGTLGGLVGITSACSVAEVCFTLCPLAEARMWLCSHACLLSSPAGRVLCRVFLGVARGAPSCPVASPVRSLSLNLCLLCSPGLRSSSASSPE